MPKVAKVAVPISLDREFDYSFSKKLQVKKGMRVLVDFQGKKRVGLVVGLAKSTYWGKLKPIIDVLDAEPSLTSEHLLFAGKLSATYPYSRGDFLFMMLPAYLKKTKKLDFQKPVNEKADMFFDQAKERERFLRNTFIKADSFPERYILWRDTIREKLKQGSVLICFPQLSYLEKAKQLFEKDFANEIQVLHSRQNSTELFSNWKKSRKRSLIIGTRVSIFYYPHDLKLIIVEEENSPYYFQEEKPFHALPEVASLLSEIKGINLILSGDYPSLTAYNFIKNGKTELIDKGTLEKKLKVVDLAGFKKGKIVGPVLSELLRKAIQDNKKAVVLWNKKGFARIISCTACGYIYKCEHCSSFLRPSLDSKEGICPYCQKKALLSAVCGHCKKGYLKSKGVGIERIESILKGIFPQAKIDSWQKRTPGSQIVLSTSKILSCLYEPERFDAGFVLDADSFLASSDYESTFEAFLYLKKLALLFKDSIYVFTHNKDYYLFPHLNKSWKDFYDLELQFRKKLNLPPFGLIIKITLRAKNETTLFKKTESLYNSLKGKFKEVYGPLKEYPFKLRDKFRYSLVIKTKRSLIFRKVIKEETKGFRTSSMQIAVRLR